MRQLLCLCLALCLALSLTAAGAEEASAWKGIRGLDWGASKEDIVALEGENYAETASMDEALGLTGLLYTEGISVSRFDHAYLAYVLGEQGLFLAGYSIDFEDAAGDYDYLVDALTSLYGPAAPEKEAEFVGLMRGFSSGTPARITCWQADRTGILLTVDDYTIEILYIGLDYFPELPGPEGSQPDTTGL